MTSTLRHDRWTARDRFVAVTLVVYALIGVAHNYVRLSARVGAGTRVAFFLVAMTLAGLALLAFGWEVRRGRRSVESLGFTVGTWRSSVLTVLVGVYLATALVGRPLPALSADRVALAFLAVLVEEMLIRPVLITCLCDRLATTAKGGALPVVLSAAVWTVIHLPSKPASMLVALFVAGVVFGAVYAWSGTNIAGYVLHALANTGSGGAVIMFVLCLVLAAAGRVIERRNRLLSGLGNGAREGDR